MNTTRSMLFAAIAASLLTAGAAHAAPLPQRVLIIPFTTFNVAESQQWMSRGIQESILSDFGRSGQFTPIAFHNQLVVEDNATAARIARQASAPLAIRGAAQVVGNDVRLTAQLIDAASGDTLTTASVTGPADSLLKLEDDLSAQLRGLPSTLNPPPAPAAAPALQTAQAPAPQIIIIQQPAQSYAPAPTYTSPAYGYGYSGYPYGGIYPFGFSTVVYTNNNSYHHRGPYVPTVHQFHTTPSTGPFTLTRDAVLPIPNSTSFSPGQINYNAQNRTFPIAAPRPISSGNAQPPRRGR